MSRPLGIQSFNAVGRQQTPPQVAVPVTVGPFSTGGGIGYEPDSTVTAVYVNTSGTSTLTITLPGTSTVPAGRRFIVQDIAGNAATKNIAVNSGGGTIHGSTTIDADYGYIEYQSNGTDWYVCNETAAAGGPTVTGADTQVAVIDSSGNIVGYVDLTFDGTNLAVNSPGNTAVISAKCGAANIISLESPGGNQWFTVGLTVTGGPNFYIGDIDGAFTGVGMSASDFDGVVQFGDIGGVSGGGVFRFDVPNQKTEQNVDHYFTSDSIGPILIDRTTATNYRLFVDNGVLDIETV